MLKKPPSPRDKPPLRRCLFRGLSARRLFVDAPGTCRDMDQHVCHGGACRGCYCDLPAQPFPSDYLRALLLLLFFGRGNGNPDSRPVWHPSMGSTIQGSVTSPGEVGALAWAKTGTRLVKTAHRPRRRRTTCVGEARAEACYPPQRSICAACRGRSMGPHTPNTCDRTPAGTCGSFSHGLLANHVKPTRISTTRPNYAPATISPATPPPNSDHNPRQQPQPQTATTTTTTTTDIITTLGPHPAFSGTCEGDPGSAMVVMPWI